MEAQQKKYKRKNFFINRKYQTFFIIRFSLGIFLSTFMLVAILLYLSKSGTSIVFKDLRLSMIPTSQYLFSSIITGLFLSLFITTSISLFLGLFISHKIAGPMHRFKLIFKDLENGHFDQKTKLRADDEWQETSKQLDDAFHSIREKLQVLNEDCKELKNSINPTNEKALQNISKLENSINQFKF